MLQTQTDKTFNRTEAAPKRLRDLAKEAMDDHDNNQTAAFEQWRNHVETTPRLMLEVIGLEWLRLAQNYFNRAVLSEPAKAMSAASKTDRALAKHKQTSAKHRRASVIAMELGILEDMQINGKALRYCTKQELEKEKGHLSGKWRFLEELIKLLPAPDARVGEVVTAAKANALYAAAKKQAAA